MKIVKKKSTENSHFYSREQSLYIAWACFRNGTPVRLVALHVIMVGKQTWVLLNFFDPAG